MSADLIHPGHLNILEIAAATCSGASSPPSRSVLDNVRPGHRSDLPRPKETPVEAKNAFLSNLP